MRNKMGHKWPPFNLDRINWNIKLAAKLILVEFITLTETLKSNILVFEIILSKIYNMFFIISTKFYLQMDGL